MYALLLKFNKPLPRYTSYPTAPEWEPFSPHEYLEKLKKLSQKENHLSLYFHIPFCKTMCLYCGCSVVLNRKEENEEKYVDFLIKEIDMVSSSLVTKKKVTQLHFGGGTPTKLSIPLFERLFKHIERTFSLDFSKEIAIEIDPRTVFEDSGEKLRFLKKLGFNRISFGVQDTDPKVQEAVKRRQSLEMTKKTFDLAKQLGFESINIDLIYGLPFQTEITFEKTVLDILEMRPDRIALFSYAKIPWLKPHQKAIKEEALPSFDVKFRIYAHARAQFVDNGYLPIGMDHFALKEDEIALAFQNKTLKRNFQGYSIGPCDTMLGFGITAIGSLDNAYVQNVKELETYYAHLEKNLLPVCRGKWMSSEDILRKWVIHTLMCTFELDKKEFSKRFNETFDAHFTKEQKKLNELEKEGLITQSSEKIAVTQLGELFVRVVAATFDAYLEKPKMPKFSSAI